MNTKLHLISLLLITGILSAQNSLIRMPRISPDGQEMAFSFQGDIFIYNFNTKQQKRLTIHEGYESNPVWNASGNQLAFSSNRKGANNIFTIKKNGGTPKQLTFYPTSDIPYDWTTSNDIIFATTRVLKGPEWDEQIYYVNANGGTPQRLITALGSMATISPDGNLVAYVKGACRISREDYSGSAQRDLWIYNIKTDAYFQITSSLKNDHSPSWDSLGNLYYIGAESGRYNIYKQTINDDGSIKEPSKKITNHNNNGVVSFSVSDNGSIVYSTLFDLYKINNGKSNKINLRIESDYKFETENEVSSTSDISDFDVSPNGKLIALEIGGEIFVKQNNKDRKMSNNVSNHSFRDRNPQWISNTELLFVSDRGGHNEIYKAVSDDSLVGLDRSLKISIEKLTESNEDVYSVLVSPNHKKLAYRVGLGNLMLADIKDGNILNSKAYSSGWAEAEDLSWSPDSKYIAYSQEDLNFDSEIFIQSVDNPKNKLNISMHPRSDRAPVWSPDGKKLAFISNRSGNRGGIDYDVWMVWLKKEDWEQSKIDRENGGYYAEKKVDKDKEKKNVTVLIDEERIFDRLTRITRLPDDEYGGMFGPDSEYVYYSATDPATNNRNFFKVKLDGSKPKAIKETSKIRRVVYIDGKFYFISEGGTLKELNPEGDKITFLAHTAKYKEDFVALNHQIYLEGTRALTMGFYDPNFHGYNWKSLINKYKPLALNASTEQDYSYVFNLLLGQLNASHMGYRAKTSERKNDDNIGLIGLEVKNVLGGVQIEYVLKNSVANKSKVNLKVGDTIKKVNDKAIDKNINFYSLLKNTEGEEVLLTMSNGKDVVVRTSGNLRNLQYEAWVESRRELVKNYSNGKLGYIHIRGMNAQSFESFERELKASGYEKKGIVIDVRYNGGGWTTDRLMAVLNVEQHAYTIPRGAADDLKKENINFKNNYPFNERAILTVNTKPTVALCNENSYSNAEIFSHAYKNLGLGKLVGQPTFGAVISTGGYNLLKGYVRMPFRAWYVQKSGLNMENDSPAVPDYLVKNAPGWVARGEDNQLQKAVEVLLEEIKL